MFTTYDGLKLPVQLGDGTTTWTAVELETSAPWFVVGLSDQECDLHRTFLFREIEEVVAFASRRIAGDLTDLRLVLPPPWSATGDWQMLRIARVEQAIAPGSEGECSMLVMSDGGTRYGGFPVEPVDCTNRKLKTLFKLLDA